MDKISNSLPEKTYDFIRLVREFGQKELFNEDSRQQKRKEIVKLINDFEKLVNYAKKVVHFTELDIEKFSQDSFEDELSGEKNNLIEKYFMEEFEKIPVVLSIGGIDIKDLNRLDWKKEYVNNFMEWDIDEFEDRIDYVLNDWEVKSKIEKFSKYGKIGFWKKDEIIEKIKDAFLTDEGDYNLNEIDFIKKYSGMIKGFLFDNEMLLKLICKEMEVQYSYENFSLTASKIYYRLFGWIDVNGLRCLEEFINDNNLD